MGGAVVRSVRVGERYAVGTAVGSRRPAAVIARTDRRGHWTVEWPNGEREEISSHQMVSVWADYEVALARYEENMAKRLTWKQLQAGAACPGCQRPLRGTHRDLAGLAVDVLRRGLQAPVSGDTWEAERGISLALAAGELLRHTGEGWVTTDVGCEALRQHDEDADWRACHTDALDIHERAASWRIAGGPTHCGFCCPPPPLSPEQIARIAELLRSAARTERESLPAPHPPKRTVRVSKEQRERLSRLAEARGMRAEQVLDELLAAAEDAGDFPGAPPPPPGGFSAARNAGKRAHSRGVGRLSRVP